MMRHLPVEERSLRLRVSRMVYMLVTVVILTTVGMVVFGSYGDKAKVGSYPTADDGVQSAPPAKYVINNVAVDDESAGFSPALIHKGQRSIEVLFLAEGSGEANCYVVIDAQSKQAAIIDPGGRNCDAIEEYLTRRRIIPAYVLITHAHRDHLGGLEYFLKRTNATVVAHPLEVERFPVSCRPISKGGTFAAERRFLYRADEQDVEYGAVRLRARMIPGHTIASLAFLLISEDIVFSGDTLFRGSIGRTDLAGNAGEENLISNLKTKLMSLDDRTRVLPGHGAFTTIGQERVMNQFLGGVR